MNSLLRPSPAKTASDLSVRRWTALGFVYWLSVVTMLEPGNVASALQAGFRPHWQQEAARLLAAALIGAAATPLLLILARRFPLKESARVAAFVVRAACVLTLAPTLILVSCFVRAWAFDGQLAPSLGEVRQQMTANLLLLVVCLSLFLGLIQRSRRLLRAAPTAPLGDMAQTWPRTLTFATRGRVTVLDLAAVEWIETQGNYQAVHAGGRTHLLRQTSESLEAQLNPALFVRIHRRTIVATASVREVDALPNGDGLVRLASGAALRMSRSHRTGLHASLSGL
jgi:DNA-binding LytR/AlgR family response regulator